METRDAGATTARTVTNEGIKFNDSSAAGAFDGSAITMVVDEEVVGDGGAGLPVHGHADAIAGCVVCDDVV